MTDHRKVEDSELEDVQGGIDDAQPLQDVTQDSGIADAQDGTVIDLSNDMIVTHDHTGGRG